jgi:hypothetical protein
MTIVATQHYVQWNYVKTPRETYRWLPIETKMFRFTKVRRSLTEKEKKKGILFSYRARVILSRRGSNTGTDALKRNPTHVRYPKRSQWLRSRERMSTRWRKSTENETGGWWCRTGQAEHRWFGGRLFESGHFYSLASFSFRSIGLDSLRRQTYSNAILKESGVRLKKKP